jgi:hypothetical protein
MDSKLINFFRIIISFLIGFSLIEYRAYFLKCCINNSYSGSLNLNPSDHQKYSKIHERNWLLKNNSLVYFSEIECGYANHVYGMLYAMTVALLTDSALIIKWKNIDKHMNEPLLNSFNHSFINISTYDLIKMPSYAANSWAYRKNLRNLINNKVIAKKKWMNQSYLIESLSGIHFEICANPQYYQKLLDYNLVQNESVQSALNALRLDSGLNQTETLEKVLQIGYEVSGSLLNEFWHPKTFIQDKIDQFLSLEFSEAYFIIGIQLRYHYLNHPNDTQKFIDCAHQIEKSYFNSSGKKTVKWFVTSDSNEILQEIKQKHPDKIILNTNGKIGHVFYEPDSYERAIMDVELLSNTDELLVTGGSTYGFLASMRKQKLPFYVNGRRNTGDEFESKCERMNLSRPSVTDLGYAVF